MPLEVDLPADAPRLREQLVLEDQRAVHRAVAPLRRALTPTGRLLVVPGDEEGLRRVEGARPARVREPLEVVGGGVEALPVGAAVAPEGQIHVAAALVQRVVARLLERDALLIDVEPVLCAGEGAERMLERRRVGRLVLR